MVRVLKRHYTLRPGVRELFRFLEGGDRAGPAGIAIYSDYPCLRERLGALGFGPGPRVRLYGPESFGAQKPAPGPFRAIAGELGVSPGETLVIGDREDTDGAGALAAGMNFLRLDDGRRRYFRLDPDRRPPGKRDAPPPRPGPAGCGSWRTICAMLETRFGPSSPP
jgi:FMN phosphatase YigB (HAD superfamily)